MTALYATAYAKLNLYLDVLGKRDDGYHNIESVMQAVTLRDDMEILIGTGDAWTVDSDNPLVPRNEDNLCYSAAKLFFDTLGEDPNGLTIHILKRIPMGAGLGGGSADAAAVLRALDVFYNKPFSLDALCSMGAQLGSDVPFCVLCGTAITEEKGQLLFPIIHEPQIYYVVCKPEASVSTAEMYRIIDERGISPSPTGTKKLVNGLHNRNISQIARNLYNVFEPLASETIPEISVIKQQLKQEGALNAMMTGSGSAVFGIFDSFDKAAEACEKMLGRWPMTFLCTNGNSDEVNGC